MNYYKKKLFDIIPLRIKTIKKRISKTLTNVSVQYENIRINEHKYKTLSQQGTIDNKPDPRAEGREAPPVQLEDDISL